VKVFNYSIPRSSGFGRETFHAKVVIADRRYAYVGSSNVTAASLDHSMEMGVTLEGKAVAEVAEVIDAVRIPPIADTHSKLIADSVPCDRGHPERGA